ncbi:hypothetical protein MMC30_008388, partial [Trapelia coarctata]|nr:hypothetical protein [Trapelia coarctata]
LAAALFLVATALSVAFLQVDPNDLETPASYSISVLLSIWSGFSFSAIKLLQVPDLPLPICTGAVNSLFNERFRHDGEGWAASCKRVALVLVIFAGALVGAAGARAGGGVSGSGRGRGMEWVVLVVALFVTVVCLGVAEGIERRRKRKERRGGGGEPLSESTAVAVEK